jgi:hypothetical protein
MAAPSTVEAAAMEAVNRRAASEARPANNGAVRETRPAVKGASIIAPVVGASVEAMGASIVTKPRTGADENAANEPIRAIVAIRSAGVRIIGIVAVGAYGRRTDVNRGAHADADHNALRVRGRCSQQEYAQHREDREDFEVSHFEAPPDYLLD